MTTIATAHHHKLLDGAAFHSFHHLVGKRKHLVVTKATNDFTCLDAFWSRTSLCQSYDFREILTSLSISHNVFPSWECRCISGEHLVLVGGIGKRRYDAVGGEENGTIESRELCTLLPPRISVVAHKVLIFLESRIVVRRKHLAMRVDVYALSFGLFEQLLQIFEVMTTDQDARTILHVNGHLCHFGMAVSTCVSTVEYIHSLHAIFTGTQGEVDEGCHIKISHGERSQSVASEVIDGEIFIAKTFGVLHISRHSFKTINNQFCERAFVCISLSQNSHFCCLCIEVIAHIAPSERVSGGQFHLELLQTSHKCITQRETALHTCSNAVIVKVSIGDGAEQSICVEVIHLGRNSFTTLTKQRFCHTNSAHDEEKEVLQASC